MSLFPTFDDTADRRVSESCNKIKPNNQRIRTSNINHLFTSDLRISFSC